MKTLFLFDLHTVRNNPYGYERVSGEIVSTLKRFAATPEAWGKTRPAILLTKHRPSQPVPNVVRLPDALGRELLRLGGEWNELAIERWKDLMLGRGRIAEIYTEMLAWLYKTYRFERYVYWGSNATIRNFARDMGLRSCAMELGPTRYPFRETRYCDFSGVNGDAHSVGLDLDEFSPMDTERWLADGGVAYKSGAGVERRYHPLLSKASRRIYGCTRPMALLALQLDADSNCLIHSGFSGMDEMVKIVVPKLVQSGWTVFVKPHPAAARERCQGKDRLCNYMAHEACRRYLAQTFGPDEAFWLDDVAPDGYLSLVDKMDAVVTINSSVGLEALLLGKVVVCLGNAPYNVGGRLPTLDDLCAGLDLPAYRQDAARICNVMLNHYLHPGLMLSLPWALDRAFSRNDMLEDAACGGPAVLTAAVKSNPI